MGGELGPSEAAAHLRDYREQLAQAKADLEALGQVQDANNGFADFLDQFKQYADAVAETKAELGEGKFGELFQKAALDPSKVTGTDLAAATSAQEKVEIVHNLLEASVERFVSTHKQLDEALGAISGGLEKTGKQVGRLTDKLGKLETWADRITNLPKMRGELTDDELIEAFTGYFGLLTDVLSGLTSLFPPLEAMLGWYGQVIAGLEQPLKAIAAGKARTNEAIASWSALLDDPYLKKAMPEPATPYATAAAEVERLEGVVAQWEERVDDAQGTTWNRLANGVEAKVLAQQQRERGQRADRTRPYVAEATFAALQPGASEEVIRRAKGAQADAASLDQDFRERLAEHVASSPWIDAEVVQVLYDRHEWLETAVTARRAGGSAGSTPAPAVSGGAVGAAGTATNLLRSRPGLVAAAGIGLVAAVGVGMSLGGGDGAPSSADQALTDPSGSSPVADAPAPVAALDACDTARRQPHDLVLSSPVIPAGGVVPAPYNNLSQEDGLSSPPLSWTGVPDEAVELAVVVVGTNQEDGRAFLTDPAPWGSVATGMDVSTNVGYRGDVKWKVTGIEPDTDGLPGMTYQEALDAGLTLHRHGVEAGLDDGWVSGFFVDSVSVNDTYLFTVFALCEPVSEAPEHLPTSWLAQNAVTYAHFAATGG